MSGGEAETWSERAERYRTSEAHAQGADLDLVVEWAEGCATAIDVATGGGHVARRLREVGLQVVTCDRAPGMQPDVICHAEELPFAENVFDLAVTRVAAHHFDDVHQAVRELARVASKRVIVVDTMFMGERAEEAEAIRDPSHVRNYSEAEWRELFADAGLRVAEVQVLVHPIDFAAWLERTGCTGADAARAAELLDDRLADGKLRMERIALRADLG
jgi:SAM-dependent methyltransferase